MAQKRKCVYVTVIFLLACTPTSSWVQPREVGYAEKRRTFQFGKNNNQTETIGRKQMLKKRVKGMDESRQTGATVGLKRRLEDTKEILSFLDVLFLRLRWLLNTLTLFLAPALCHPRQLVMLLPQLAQTLPLLLQTRLQLQDQHLRDTHTCALLLTWEGSISKLGWLTDNEGKTGCGQAECWPVRPSPAVWSGWESCWRSPSCLNTWKQRLSSLRIDFL